MRIIGLAAGLLIGLATSSAAATLNNIRYQNGGTSDPACGAGFFFAEDSTTDFSRSYSQSAAGCQMGINASIVGGGLGVFASTTSVPGGNIASSATVGATTTVSEIFVTPTNPATYTGPFLIPVSANITLDGNLASSILSAARFVRSAAARVNANVTLSGARGLGGTDGVFDFRRFDDSVGVTNSPGDASSTKTLIGSLNPTIMHDFRRPLTIRMQLSGTAGAYGGRDSSAAATLNAMNTLSFSKTGPAFDLPDGFTVNAPELNIFDNRWIDPRIIVTPSAVPLPAGLPLLLAGLGTLGLLRRALVCRT